MFKIYNRVTRYLSLETGTPYEFVRYQFSQIVAFCLATLFRKPLRGCSPVVRHSMCLVLGLGLAYLHHEKTFVHLVVLPMLLFVLLKINPLRYAGHVTLSVSLVYLWFVDLNRWSDANTRVILATCLMSITQKVSSLGYCLQDRALGRDVNPKLSGRTKGPNTWFDRVPPPLEFFAYLLELHTSLFGPVIFYADYMNFIEETDFKEFVGNKRRPLPSPIRAIIYKVTAIVLLNFTMFYSVKYYSHYILRYYYSEILNWSPLYLLWYAFMAGAVARLNYYVLFLNTEVICNNAGMGFNGYSLDGKPKWDGLTNYDLIKHELGLSLRTSVAAWNIRTHAWLRGVAYERGNPRWRTARACTLSAIWHGAFPGYFGTFLTGILLTLAGRKIRAVVRPLFLDTKGKKLFYDAITFIGARAAMTYSMAPFHLLDLEPVLAFYGKFYFIPHFVSMLLIIMYPEESLK